MIELISTPYKNRDEQTLAGAMKWLMVHNPLYYEMKRKGITVKKLSFYDEGAFVYYDSSYGTFEEIGLFGSSVVDDGFYTVIDSIVIGSEIRAYLYLPENTISQGTYYNDGYLLEKDNFYLEVLIYDKSTETSYTTTTTNATLLTTHKVRANEAGIAKVDLSGILANFFEYKTDIDYSLINSIDSFATKNIVMYVKEVIDGVDGTLQRLNDFNVINGAKQIQDNYGASANDYCYDPTEDLTEKAKFLTLFTPTYFEGYPFSLSFINLSLSNFDESAEGLTSQLIKVDNSVETNLIVSGTQDKINALTLDGGYSVNNILVSLKQNGTVVNENAYVEADYVDPGYVNGINTDTLTEFTLTEELKVNINQECVIYPTYLRWLNELGGYNYWLFSGNNQSMIDIQDSNVFNRTIEDIEFATGSIQYLKRNIQKSIVVGANNLNKNDKQLVLSSAYSRMVQMYNPSTELWIDILIKANSFDVGEAKETRSDIELEIMLPKTYLQ